MKKEGLTIIELIVVIGLMAVLATVILITVSPAERLARARNEARERDVEAIYANIKQYAFQHGGAFPECVTETETDITGCDELVPTYLANFPMDPICGDETAGDSGYYVKRSPEGELGVKAVCAEEEKEVVKGFW